jgi:hypothetical protein
MTSTSGERSRSGVALRLPVMPSRFGCCNARFGAPGRLFEIAPVAGGCGVAGVVAGVVVVELASSLLGDHPKDPEV